MSISVDVASMLLGFLVGIFIFSMVLIWWLPRRLRRLRQDKHAIQTSLSALEQKYVLLNNDFEHAAEKAKTLDVALSEARQLQEKHQTDKQAISLQLAELKITHQEKIRSFAEQQKLAAENRKQMTAEFQHLSQQILDEKSKQFSDTNQTQLDHLLKPFRQQLERFERRVNTVHDESIKGQAGLAVEIKKVVALGVQMNDEAQRLSRTLKGDKKAVGQWGEAQLARTLQLAGLVAGEHYEAQAVFRDEKGKHNFPDFVIKLPDQKHMVIDSKVSLVDYDQAMGAEDEAEQAQFLQGHVRAVKAHIENLAEKDYASLPGMSSPSFVLMFMPIEAAYIDAMKHDKSLFNYGYEKGVILVSHTTLMPILRTVANLWTIQHSHDEARSISEKAGEIYKQVSLVAERVLKVGGSLNALANHYNGVVKAVAGQQGLYGKVDRFEQLSAKVAKKLPQLDPLHVDLESEKLALMTEAGAHSEITSAVTDASERCKLAEDADQSDDASTSLVHE